MDTPQDTEWHKFLAMSIRIGSDLSLVQGAGGNTSLKRDGVLWVKASGTWLAEALTKPVMVPVNLAAIRKGLDPGQLTEGDIAGMTLGGGLRASVETPFHAAIEAACVVHVHCVATLAVAIRQDAEAILTERLRGLDWGFIPYLKPGLPLTRALIDRGLYRRAVIVLGNHGLIVSGATPDAAEMLLRQVQARLEVPISPTVQDFRPGFALEGSGYRAANPGALHALELDPKLRELALRGSYAPDFVVFFGPSVPRVKNTDDLRALKAPLPLNSVVLVADHGVALREDAMRGTEDILTALHATLARVTGPCRTLTSTEVAELMTWDAEAYRQSLNRRGE